MLTSFVVVFLTLHFRIDWLGSLAIWYYLILMMSKEKVRTSLTTSKTWQIKLEADS